MAAGHPLAHSPQRINRVSRRRPLPLLSTAAAPAPAVMGSEKGLSTTAIVRSMVRY